jgi:pimeloyl-ACP methyl ester carboxylesterase
MPYATHQDVRIHYQVEGEGPPLVLQHGFTHSLTHWYMAGYVDALKTTYQLILVDARGHGASAKPHDPAAYTAVLRVSDVVAVLDALHLRKVHYCGYSMGGWIGFALAQYVPERFHSLMLGEMHPYKRAPASLNQRVELLRQGMDAFVASVEAHSGPIAPQRRALLLANDAQTLLASQLSMRDAPSFEAVLPTITMPCLLFAGDADTEHYPYVTQCVPHMPHVTFIALPGLNHLECFNRSDLVLPHVTTFLAQVTQ